MKDIKVTDSVKYIGVDDHDIDLFESQYVVPNGVSYNSYVILDEKVAVMDTVDARKTDEWFVNLEEALDGRNVDYIVVSHMEPDHAASLRVLVEKYPEAKPDLVLMDITMPEMDGIEALKKIKALDPGAKIIMCSAMGQQAMVIEAIQSGAKDFIVKPFQAERVLEAVKKVVG